jgi:hypothetical protein
MGVKEPRSASSRRATQTCLRCRRGIPPASRRVFGAVFTFVLIAVSAGVFITLAVLNATDLATTLWLEGLGIPLLCLAGWPWLRRMDEANGSRLAEIAPRVALLEHAATLIESTRSAVETLARQSTTVDVSAGQEIVRQGDAADALYLIQSGILKVRSHGESNEEVQLALLGTTISARSDSCSVYPGRLA